MDMNAELKEKFELFYKRNPNFSEQDPDVLECMLFAYNLATSNKEAELKQLTEAYETLLKALPIIKLPPVLVDNENAREVIDIALKGAVTLLKSAFDMCQLKTHISGRVEFENSDEVFHVSFITNGYASTMYSLDEVQAICENLLVKCSEVIKGRNGTYSKSAALLKDQCAILDININDLIPTK